MYPLLILRSEFVCLVILIFLLFIARAYNIDKESKSFRRILTFAIIHVIFDAITVITVNNMDLIPAWLNWTCHVIFYVSAILYAYEIVSYIFAICYPKMARKIYAFGHIITALYICSLAFLKIEYVEDLGTYSSTGVAAYVGYGLAFSFFIAAFVIMFAHMDRMSVSIKGAMIPMMIVLMITEVSQIIWRSVLFTGGAVTIVTVGFFFSLENPVEVFKKKALTDALTGVQSRNSYEEDIAKYDKDFKKHPNNDYTFVFCDLNDLRNVNNHFGHNEGDSYITLIASSIKECMKNSNAVYRIGGDEFLILYYKTDIEIVKKEIADLQDTCKRASADLDYVASVAIGYATSSSDIKSLDVVVKNADYAMYHSKALMKSDKTGDSAVGAKMNYAGLTDALFEAMCASNASTYPFITNMDTNVTRIAPSWKEYFGLEDEFYNDFLGMWKDHIHPDYYEGYMADVVACINGHKKYHHYDYLAKRQDGEYVMVSCHGSVYVDSNTDITYFTGFIINHGLDENTDPITGLNNFDVLTGDIYKLMDEGKAFSVLKLKLNNFARVNTLYGYDVGNEVIKNVAELLVKKAENIGEVYCQASLNFTILFNDSNKEILETYYKRISESLLAGVLAKSRIIPVVVSAGAYLNNGTKVSQARIRSGLVFAVEESNYNQRNSIVYFHEDNIDNPDNDISLLTEIHADAITNMKNFFLRYQPIIDAQSLKPIGAEALLRWKDEKLGEIAPNRFIGFLENDPCFYRLGLRIIEQAVTDAKKIQEQIKNFTINVNITALQLQNDNFANDIIQILNKYNYQPNDLILELTERCKVMDSSFLASKIAELRNKGIKVAFDDLGTGYSTISLLMDIPVDEIKLDKDFVSHIGENEKYQFFVKALAAGKTANNNYNICFEGIENEKILADVKQFGSFLVQGYHFAKPLVMNEFTDYISNANKQ